MLPGLGSWLELVDMHSLLLVVLLIPEHWLGAQDGGNMVMRQSGAIDSGQRVHIYSADMRRSISLQFYPDGYDLVEPQPVLVSEGYSSHQAGTQGKQRLPEKFHVARAGSEPQEIFLDRDIDMEAWQMQDKVCTAHMCCDR